MKTSRQTGAATDDHSMMYVFIIIGMGCQFWLLVLLARPCMNQNFCCRKRQETGIVGSSEVGLLLASHWQYTNQEHIKSWDPLDRGNMF